MKPCSSLHFILLTFTLFLPAFSSAQSDSVTSGRHTRNSRIQIGNLNPDPNQIEPPKLSYILQSVKMASTGGNCARKIVMFGPFENSSEFPLTITLNHVGGSSHQSSTSAINGKLIARAVGGSQSFTIPSKSIYQWWAENDHTISAWVPTDAGSTYNFGLPSAQAFSFPSRTGKYKGCLHTYNYVDGQYSYDVLETTYYFTVSPMTDHSDCWGTPVETPEFGTVVPGPPPENPEACANLRVPPPPPDYEQGS